MSTPRWSSRLVVAVFMIAAMPQLVFTQEPLHPQPQVDEVTQEAVEPVQVYRSANRFSEKEVRMLLLMVASIAIAGLILMILAKAFASYVLGNSTSHGPSTLEREDGYVKPSGRFRIGESTQRYDIRD